MSQAVLTSDRRSNIRRTIFVIDILLLLAPPVHWLFSEGQSTIWYFLVANALVTLSLFGLWMTRDTDEEETA
ncbi:hypothetical protein ACFRJ9_03235 [Paenarthrobacter sp. NPDC056912]|uniref:hypothetical protein n=1 Tax=Paenarthrobacter sp. NPDC056912 TaxID=3345965 RepID=UPI00366C9E80